MKIILLAAISANGKIAEHECQTSLDWTSKEDLRFFIEKTKEIGVLIMGRKTFETIGKPLKGRKTIVMTREDNGRQLETKEESGKVEFTSEQPCKLLERLQKEGVENVVIAGGSSIYSQFLKEKLVTEIYLTVEPVLFGDGVPLASGFGRINLKLDEVTQLGDQAVLLHFLCQK
ncbi:dihydrofolate reductase [Candidatus Uhrbacteria bacterium]|nr:dihydrofolate reductase [Candidatus Uhrbacteria bacterium]